MLQQQGDDSLVVGRTLTGREMERSGVLRDQQTRDIELYRFRDMGWILLDQVLENVRVTCDHGEEQQSDALLDFVRGLAQHRVSGGA